MAGDVTRHDDIITFTVLLITQAGQVAWAARVFLLPATEATSGRTTS
jgi:hypothetical protein